MESARDLLHHELADMYDGEKRLLSAFKKMAREAKDSDLREAFKSHRKETEGHVQRLEEVFGALDEKPTAETCQGLRGLVKEFTNFVSQEQPSEEVMNFFVVSAAKKVELYEISAYASLIELAVHARMPEAADLLQETLIEEREALNKLQGISANLGTELSSTS
jgi:ferritin-like metal-binding protein YciE